MKKYLSLLLVLPCAALCRASQLDSLAVNALDEVTVVAARQRADAARTVYLPDAVQRRAASDGLSLLARMNIPQLSVNPLSATVTTADGQSVSVFVDSRKATPEDVAGLDPADVKRVEYLDFPADARFGGAQHVVNFVTHAYAYGGYTKASAKERFVAASGEASVYSRFAYKAMEYDVMLSGEYDHSPHTGSRTEELYRLDGADIVRASITDASRYRSRDVFGGVRASWRKGQSLSWRNMLSVRRSVVSDDDSEGTVSITGMDVGSAFTSSSPSAATVAGWDSDIFADAGKGWTMAGSISAELRRSRSTSDYTTALSDIHNRAREKAWFVQADVRLNRRLSDKVTVFADVRSAFGRTRITYRGSGDADNLFRQSFTGCYPGVSFSLGRFSGYADAGYAFESNAVNGVRVSDSYPFTHLSVRWLAHDRHTADLWVQYASFTPDAAMKNPNTVRQSELMYIAGNDGLECSRNVSASLSWLWLPDNRWQLTAFASLFKIINRQIALYEPAAPGGMMLKKYYNDGDYNHGQAGMRLALRLLDGRLQLSASPRVLLYRTTGTNRISHYPVMAGATADYYAGDFAFSAYWASPYSYVDGETAFLRKMPSEYSVGVVWAHRGWNVQLTAANFLRRSWVTSRDTLRTPFYDSRVVQYGSQYHSRIALSVAYTFRYGKKVDASQEISGDTGIATSILR